MDLLGFDLGGFVIFVGTLFLIWVICFYGYTGRN